jgi:hypothetical protein
VLYIIIITRYSVDGLLNGGSFVKGPSARRLIVGSPGNRLKTVDQVVSSASRAIDPALQISCLENREEVRNAQGHGQDLQCIVTLQATFDRGHGG